MKAIISYTGVLLIGFITISIFLNSCESNTGVADAERFPPKIYMPQAVDKPATHSLPIVDSAQTIIYGAVYGGAGTPDEDINVNFSVNNALVDSINAADGTNFLPLPEAAYELSQPMATIPSGELSTGPLELNITTVGTIAPLTPYLLPVSIEADSDVEINADLKTTFFAIEGIVTEYDRTGWQIADVDSEQPGFPVANILDGNPGTFWHTEFSPNRPPHPHHVTINFGETLQVLGLRIVGREGFTRGDPREIKIAVSSDGENFDNEETFSTTFDTENENRFFLSAPRSAQYVRITTTGSFGFPGEDNLPIVHFSEAYAF